MPFLRAFSPRAIPYSPRTYKPLKMALNCDSGNGEHWDGDTGGERWRAGDTPPPPPMEWQKCLCPRPKFAPYFLTNHFRFNSILKKRRVGLRKCRKNTFCSQENVEKRGIWGEKWRGRLCLGADVRNGRPLEMGRFEGNGGGRRLVYGGF